jgi:hypothetical protein
LPKGERALVKLDNAEAEVRALKKQGLSLETLGKERLTELDVWAYSMAQQFAPKKEKKTGRLYWENDGDEARFLRFFKLCGEYAAARAPYESPRLAAIAAGNLGGDDPDAGDDPHERLMRIIDNWIAADEAEKAERVAQGLPANETEALRLENASLREEVARLRGLPAPAGERVIDPPTSDIVPPGEQGRLYVGPPPPGPDDPKPRSTAAIDGKAVPTGTTDAEREANRQRVNNDRSAYTQQGLRPAGGEPWRGHAGGVDESFFWGGSTGKRAW